MNWGSDELHHRSAEQSGWCAELRAADPEDVDETVTGAAEYAAATQPHSPDDTESTDALTIEATTATAYTCAFCDQQVPEEEALDAAGAPLAGEFDWLGTNEAYHCECIPAGEGRFLPWTANGILADDSSV